MSTATPIYRAIMLEVERRRIALGLPMDKFSEYAGLPERYYSKALHADVPCGRQAQWSTLQVMVAALFPNGFDVIIKPVSGPVISADNLKAKLLRLQATKDPKSQRELMRELGIVGGKRSGESRRRKADLRYRRRQRARIAARIRWRREKHKQ